jgi:hypothetical protein
MSAHSGQRTASQLLQLSEEVSRIATSLAKLSDGEAAPLAKLVTATGGQENVSAEGISAVIRRRRQRSRYFPQELLADPMWNMMLDLLRAEVLQHRVTVSDACQAAGVPATTALRWLKTMEQRGFVVRNPDPHDGRRVFVSLTPQASLAVRNWFADCFSNAA